MSGAQWLLNRFHLSVCWSICDCLLLMRINSYLPIYLVIFEQVTLIDYVFLLYIIGEDLGEDADLGGKVVTPFAHGYLVLCYDVLLVVVMYFVMSIICWGYQSYICYYWSWSWHVCVSLRPLYWLCWVWCAYGLIPNLRFLLNSCGRKKEDNFFHNSHITLPVQFLKRERVGSWHLLVLVKKNI